MPGQHSQLTLTWLIPGGSRFCMKMCHIYKLWNHIKTDVFTWWPFIEGKAHEIREHALHKLSFHIIPLCTLPKNLYPFRHTSPHLFFILSHTLPKMIFHTFPSIILSSTVPNICCKAPVFFSPFMLSPLTFHPYLSSLSFTNFQVITFHTNFSTVTIHTHFQISFQTHLLPSFLSQLSTRYSHKHSRKWLRNMQLSALYCVTQ